MLAVQGVQCDGDEAEGAACEESIEGHGKEDSRGQIRLLCSSPTAQCESQEGTLRSHCAGDRRR